MIKGSQLGKKINYIDSGKTCNGVPIRMLGSRQDDRTEEVTREDKIKNECIIGRIGVVSIVKGIRENLRNLRLRWLGHV